MHLERLKPYYALLFAVGLAAALEAIHVARSATISADGITFIAIARDLAQAPAEAFRRHDQHPGYPAMLLGAAQVVHWCGYQAEPHSWAVAGTLVSYLCGLASVVFVWLLARNLFDARAANFTAIAFAALPVLCWNAGDAHSDVPHLAAYLLAAWLASSGIISGNPWTLAAAGAASAAAYWIRPEGLEVYLIALVCIAWQALRGHWAWKKAAIAMSALSAATLLVAAPYPILAGKFTSKQLPFAKTQPAQTFIDLVATTERPAAPVSPAPLPAPAAAENTATIATPTAPAPAISAEAAPASSLATETPTRTIDSPRYTPKLIAKLLGQGFSAFINSICQGFKFIFIPFYFIGQIECARRRPQWLQIGMLSMLGATHFCVLLAVFMLSGYIAHRHVLPMVAIAMPVAALGILYVGDRAAARWRLSGERVSATILAICCVAILPYTVRALNLEFIPVMAATSWVDQHTDAKTGVVCNSPYVSFYGHRAVAYLSHEAPSLTLALAKADQSTRYEYVVLHVNAHEFQPEWIEQIEERYEQVGLYPDPSSIARPKEVRVYRARELAQDRVAGARHGDGADRK